MDAETDPRARLRSTSERDGRVVTEAGNGRDALDLFPLAEPSVALLDLSMPVMDGFDGLASLRARPDGAHVSVMMLTVRDLDREDRRSLSGDSQILNRGT